MYLGHVQVLSKFLWSLVCFLCLNLLMTNYLNKIFDFYVFKFSKSTLNEEYYWPLFFSDLNFLNVKSSTYNGTSNFSTPFDFFRTVLFKTNRDSLSHLNEFTKVHCGLKLVNVITETFIIWQIPFGSITVNH